MSESKKKKAGETPTVNKADIPLPHLLLDCLKDKYRLVGQAIRWAQEIKKRDQSNEPAPELLNKALREILTEQVNVADIEKLPPLPKVEKKAPEAVASKAAEKPEPEEKALEK